VSRSARRADKGVVSRAKVKPVGGRENMTRHLRHFLRHDNSETLFQVPVNMAVDEPWARIVRHEPDREVIRRAGAHARNVADDGVIIVVSRGSSAADHMEVVSVQVDGVRPTLSTTRDRNFDALVGIERVDASRRHKLFCVRTIQDLQQDRDVRALEGDVVDEEAREVRAELHCQVDVLIGTARERFSGHRNGIEWVKLCLVEW